MAKSRLEKQLSTNETIVFKAERHWIRYVIYYRNITLLIMALLGLFALAYFLEDFIPPEVVEYRYWVLLLPAYSILHFYVLYRRRKFLDGYDEMIVTRDNIIRTHGVKAQKTSSLALQHVEIVNINQTLMGKILGYGDIEIRSQGNSAYASFQKVKDPVGFRNSVITEKERIVGTQKS